MNWFVRAFPFMTTVTPTSLIFSVVLGIAIGTILALIGGAVWWCFAREPEGRSK